MSRRARLHMGLECDRKFEDLIAALQQFMEQHGRGGTLAYIPEASDERPFVAMNGKLLSWEGVEERIPVEAAINNALNWRYKPTDAQIALRDRLMNEAGQRWQWEYQASDPHGLGWLPVDESHVPEGLVWSTMPGEDEWEHAMHGSSQGYMRRLIPRKAVVTS